MRLYILDLGRCDVDKGAVLTPGSGEGVRVMIPIAVVARLGQLGLAPEDVHILVSTHFHFDHAGNHDPAHALASAWRLAELARAEDALLIYGHDPVQWETLRKSPRHYD